MNQITKNRYNIDGDLKEYFDSLPNMTPDLIDDFITWICERFDLVSFKQSTPNFKKRQLKKFLRDCSDDQLQYRIAL